MRGEWGAPGLPPACSPSCAAVCWHVTPQSCGQRLLAGFHQAWHPPNTAMWAVDAGPTHPPTKPPNPLMLCWCRYGDITRLEDCLRALRGGVVGIFHLAAMSKVLPSMKDVSE